jgi:hypothetical protein
MLCVQVTLEDNGSLIIGLDSTTNSSVIIKVGGLQHFPTPDPFEIPAGNPNTNITHCVSQLDTSRKFSFVGEKLKQRIYPLFARSV